MSRAHSIARTHQRMIDGAREQARKLRAAAKKETDPARRAGFERAAATYKAVADAKAKELKRS